MQLKNTKNCIWKFFCLCVYQRNEALSGGNSADTDNDFSWNIGLLLAMHKYAHFRKSPRRWRPQFPFLFYFFFALVNEEPSLQCMCNVCTILQRISSSEMEPGLNLWPVTQPNPTRTLFDPVNRPGHWVPGAVNWEIILMTVCYSECFLPKVWSMQHTYRWRKFPT